MTPNAFLCAHCSHHERDHIGRRCEGSAYCTCTGFTPGNCPVCAGFGCTTCHDTITSLVDWQLHESPAAQSEQRRRENAARWNWRGA